MKQGNIRKNRTYTKIDKIVDKGTPCKGLMFLISITEDVYLDLMARRRRIEPISTTIDRELRMSKHWERDWDNHGRRKRETVRDLHEPRKYTSATFRARHPDTRPYASCNLRKTVMRGKCAREIDRLKFEECHTLVEIMEKWEREDKENKINSA